MVPVGKHYKVTMSVHCQDLQTLPGCKIPTTNRQLLTAIFTTFKHYCASFAYSKQVTCLSVSMDGTMLASGSQDGNVRIWDVLSLQCIKTLLHKGKPRSVRVCYQTKHINQGSCGGHLRSSIGFGTKNIITL